MKFFLIAPVLVLIAATAIVRKRTRPALTKTIHITILLVIGCVFATISAADTKINKTGDDVAINGYDTVAYFVDGKATRGSPDHQVVWQDARWYFANDEHRQLFESDPSRYAPQFGGWCAAGIAEGQYYAVDAETWTIVDGKLYLNYDRDVEQKWREERDRNIAQAEQIWAAGTIAE